MDGLEPLERTVTATDTYHWEITAGDTEVVRFAIVDEDGEAIDVSGATFTCEIRERRGVTGTVSATATCAVEDTNVVVVTLSSTQTRALGDNRRRFFSDLQGVESGVTTTYFPMTVSVDRDTTE